MTRLFAVCVVLAFASSAAADDKQKPHTLTAREIADGWLLLFDGDSTFGWEIEEGTVEVKGGKLVIGGAEPTKLRTTTAFPGVMVNMTFRTADGKGATGGSLSQGDVAHKFANLINDDRLMPWTCERRMREPFVIEVPAGQTIVLERLQVRPIADSRPASQVSLFTGKNLDGWKVNAADPKRMASKWEVTKGGELSLKNGPGDLVTEAEFDNFLLQLECKTLGKGLNSGVFFRCAPGQYQQGYETQIQNLFRDDDRTRPLDYGTGAIYRRVPARKVVANDNEWFMLTVVADGRHIATWVNGYPVVDWTDDRKDNDNPRNGYRAAKGPISIQGHDPTTDLLFRNLRITELPTQKK